MTLSSSELFGEAILSGDNETSFLLWLGGDLFLSAHLSLLRTLRCWGHGSVGKSTSMQVSSIWGTEVESSVNL